jgi:N-acyl-L-homoserine lactone synthetase
MVVALSGRTCHLHPDHIDKMFRLRYHVFIKMRGWSLPSCNGKEIDQYDDCNAVYFLDIGSDNNIYGSVRMTPTETSSLIADYFAHLIENGQSPRRPDIYECTRYIVQPPRKSRADNRRAKARLLGAMVAWSLERGLAYVQTVIDTSALPTFLAMTPQTIPLGLSHPYGGGRATPGGGECMAIRWPITVAVLNDIRAYGDVQDDPPMTERLQNDRIAALVH